LSESLKYARKYIEEGLSYLHSHKKITKKEIGKKQYYLALPNEDLIANKEILSNKISLLITAEKE